MSSGGGSGNTTTTMTNIPDWLQEPTQRMVARGESLTGPDAQFQQYGGQRVADFSPLQQQAFQGVANMHEPGQYGQANAALGSAQDIANAGAAQSASYGPGQFQGATYNPALQGNVSGVGTDTFDQNAANQYMNPYQQSVTDIAKQKAAMEGQQMMNKLGGVAAQNGAFGGSRFGLEQAQQMRDLGMNLSNIQTQGSSAAYQNAQNQFNADQSRGLQAGMFNAGAANTAGAANQAAENTASQFGGANYMTAQQQAEQSRQYANDASLRGAQLASQTGLSAASQYAGLGNSQQQAELDRLNALGSAGAQQQAQGQKYADTAYGNFVDARDFDRNNLQFLSGLLRGNNTSTSQSITQPVASTASQLGGLGLGAIGAYKMFGG